MVVIAESKLRFGFIKHIKRNVGANNYLEREKDPRQNLRNLKEKSSIISHTLIVIPDEYFVKKKGFKRRSLSIEFECLNMLAVKCY